MRKPEIDDGYWVVFANTTEDDRKDKPKNDKERNRNMIKFRTFLFPAKYYDQTTKTANELVQELKPNASVIPFIDKNLSPLVYDTSFFNEIKGGNDFIDIWYTVAASNPAYTDKIMIKIFRAISQTALKMEYLHKKEANGDIGLESFFDTMWNHENDEKNYYKKFIKKLGELKIIYEGKETTMLVTYQKLLKDFPTLKRHVEDICMYPG